MVSKSFAAFKSFSEPFSKLILKHLASCKSLSLFNSQKLRVLLSSRCLIFKVLRSRFCSAFRLLSRALDYLTTFCFVCQVLFFEIFLSSFYFSKFPASRRFTRLSLSSVAFHFFELSLERSDIIPPPSPFVNAFFHFFAPFFQSPVSCVSLPLSPLGNPLFRPCTIEISLWYNIVYLRSRFFPLLLEKEVLASIRSALQGCSVYVLSLPSTTEPYRNEGSYAHTNPSRPPSH